METFDLYSKEIIDFYKKKNILKTFKEETSQEIFDKIILEIKE